MVLGFGVGVDAAQASASDRLMAFQKEVRSLTGEFRQRVTDKHGAVIQSSSGQVVLARPFKFRWDYRQPYEQAIVSDGSRVWFFDADLEQVTIRDVDASMGGGIALFLSGEQPIESQFTLRSQPDRAGLEWVAATPRAGNGEFEQIRVGFRGSNLAVIEVTDHFGQTTRLELYDVVENPAVPDSRFVFVAPDGVDVLRSGEQ